MQVWRNVDCYQLLGKFWRFWRTEGRVAKDGYTIIRIVGTIVSAMRGYPLPKFQHPDIEYGREIGNIPDTWDGCYLGQTLDVSMTTAGSRPISFEFRVNQRFRIIGN